MECYYLNVVEWLERKPCFNYIDIFTFYKKSGISSVREIQKLIKKTLENNQIRRYGKNYVFINVFSTI